MPGPERTQCRSRRHGRLDVRHGTVADATILWGFDLNASKWAGNALGPHRTSEGGIGWSPLLVGVASRNARGRRCTQGFNLCAFGASMPGGPGPGPDHGSPSRISALRGPQQVGCGTWGRRRSSLKVRMEQIALHHADLRQQDANLRKRVPLIASIRLGPHGTQGAISRAWARLSEERFIILQGSGSSVHQCPFPHVRREKGGVFLQRVQASPGTRSSREATGAGMEVTKRPEAFG